MLEAEPEKKLRGRRRNGSVKGDGDTRRDSEPHRAASCSPLKNLRVVSFRVKCEKQNREATRKNVKKERRRFRFFSYRRQVNLAPNELRAKGSLTVTLLAVPHFRLEVANLAIDVEPKSRRAFELENFAAGTPVVLGAIAHAVDKLGIPVELGVADALDALDGALRAEKASRLVEARRFTCWRRLNGGKMRRDVAEASRERHLPVSSCSSCL